MIRSKITPFSLLQEVVETVRQILKVVNRRLGSVVDVDADYTVTEDDEFIVSSAAGVTVVLPNHANEGMSRWIVNQSAGDMYAEENGVLIATVTTLTSGLFFPHSTGWIRLV